MWTFATSVEKQSLNCVRLNLMLNLVCEDVMSDFVFLFFFYQAEPLKKHKPVFHWKLCISIFPAAEPTTFWTEANCVSLRAERDRDECRRGEREKGAENCQTEVVLIIPSK